MAGRVTDQEFLWHREVRTKPEVEEHFRLDLDIGQAKMAIEQLEFMQLKGEEAFGHFLGAITLGIGRKCPWEGIGQKRWDM